MSSIVDFNINKTSSADDKWHLVLIYLVHEDGLYQGSYYEPSSHSLGGVSGKSCDEMVDDAYESLEEFIEDEINIPFDIKTIKESVQFDLVECHNVDEMDEAYTLRRNGITGEEINKTILQ